MIDPAGRNLAGRLIDSAIGYAARRYRDQQTRPHPVPAESLTHALHRDADRNADRLQIEQFTDPVGRVDDHDTTDDGSVSWAVAGHPHGEGLDRVLRRVAAQAGQAGTPISTPDLELIAATRLHRQPLPEVAVRLGIGVEAAYKRRQRAEQRLSTVLQHTP